MMSLIVSFLLTEPPIEPGALSSGGRTHSPKRRKKNMPRFKYDWGDKSGYVTYTTRHLPKLLHKKLVVFAAAEGISVEKALNMALDRGLLELSKARR